MATARLSNPTIVLIGTLDTKGPEIAYVADRVRSHGGRPLVLDSGILGEPSQIVPDITRDEVARAGGHELGAIRDAGSRGAAVELMAAGVRATCLRLYDNGSLKAVLCLGGAEGALLGAAAMHALPLGVPKLIVSPSASGRRAFGPFMGRSDVVVMHSVIDILGINAISRAIFDNAAAAIVGMAQWAGEAVATHAAAPHGSTPDTSDRTGDGALPIGVTMLGQTTPGVMHLREHLHRAGLETVTFHANGVGGPAMEELLAAGMLSGVIDYTLSELANTITDGIHATGPDRLRVAGRLGVPQLIVPGCVDFFNQGVPVPERYRDRKLYYHNPVATLVRLNHAETIELAELVAERLNEASGPVAVVLPTRGFSLSGTDGGALSDPELDAAFLDKLESRLRDGITVKRVDAAVNDEAVAHLAAQRYVRLTTGAHVG